jgi:hypothetical protein
MVMHELLPDNVKNSQCDIFSDMDSGRETILNRFQYNIMKNINKLSEQFENKVKFLGNVRRKP